MLGPVGRYVYLYDDHVFCNPETIEALIETNWEMGIIANEDRQFYLRRLFMMWVKKVGIPFVFDLTPFVALSAKMNRALELLRGRESLRFKGQVASIMLKNENDYRELFEFGDSVT